MSIVMSESPGVVPMPKRIQLSRQKGWKMPPNTLKVDRSTRWGNPFSATLIATTFCNTVTGHFPAPIIYFNEPKGLGRCIDLYIAWLAAKCDTDPQFLMPLRGKNLGCWCKPGALCHADVLLRIANA